MATMTDLVLNNGTTTDTFSPDGLEANRARYRDRTVEEYILQNNVLLTWKDPQQSSGKADELNTAARRCAATVFKPHGYLVSGSAYYERHHSAIAKLEFVIPVDMDSAERTILWNWLKDLAGDTLIQTLVESGEKPW